MVFNMGTNQGVGSEWLCDLICTFTCFYSPDISDVYIPHHILVFFDRIAIFHTEFIGLNLLSDVFSFPSQGMVQITFALCVDVN